MGRPKGSKNGNPQIAAGIVNRKEPFDAEKTVSESGIDGKAIKEMARERSFDKIDNKFQTINTLRDLTKSAIVVKNYPMAILKNITHDPNDWGVSYFFPIAEDESGKRTATYVDVPTSKRQIELCVKKATLMEKAGFRYRVFMQNTILTADNIKEELANKTESLINEAHVVSL